MRFRIRGEDGRELDAAVELEAAAIVVLSRGGTSGSSNSQNQDYPTALRLILRRLEKRGRRITGAWVDSMPAQKLPPADRQILFPSDMPCDAKALFSLMGRRMESVGRAPGSVPNKGNRNKRLRIEVDTNSVGELASVIDAKADADVPRSALRLPSADLRRVTAAGIWSAIEQLRTGGAAHDFDDSTDYDLVDESGERLPPKAVFGLAATAALGFPVQPVNFSGGVGTVCFDMLTAAGWQIVRKGGSAPTTAPALNAEDREWAEGDARRLGHLRRERHAGVAKAKKAQMREQHGKLFCEECKMDPVAAFGDASGEACIEVHHRDTEVAQMGPGHRTRLVDVECLCANCHRVRHRRIKDAQRVAADLSTP
jgi:hypothetical protein